MVVAVWTAFLLIALFLLGSAIGSFLNVCIVRLPQGRSLIRPASCCGHCHTPIRLRDNIPLFSYWKLHGRCHACGAAFSMRYFWIELLTGLLFVLIYHLEIGCNIHHFNVWSAYDNNYEYIFMRMFDPQPWLLFAFHAALGCFLIVATMCVWEQQRVPASVTWAGLLVGLLASLLCPWPWPEPPAQAIAPPAVQTSFFAREHKAYAWGPRVGAMPADRPWWNGDVTPRSGLYPWPIWGPLPEWLPPGGWRLGLATGLAGVLAAALLMGLIRLAFNATHGSPWNGAGAASLLMVAGGFLGWQPIVVAALLGVALGLVVAMGQKMVRRRSQASFAFWLAPPVAVVWFGWYWLGPLVQGLFFNATRLLWLVAALAVCAAALGLATLRRSVDASNASAKHR